MSEAGLTLFKNCKKLTSLHIEDTKVTDLSLLKEMPLNEVWCRFQATRDADILRSIKTLESINGKPAAEFWKEVDAGTTPATPPATSAPEVEKTEVAPVVAPLPVGSSD